MVCRIGFEKVEEIYLEVVKELFDKSYCLGMIGN
jgi:hypothetical protein